MKVFVKSKKAQSTMNINSIGTIAIALLLAAVILGMGGVILEKIQNTQTRPTIAHPNETLTWLGNNTAISLLTGDLTTGTFKLYNNGSLINQGLNYTVDEGAGTVTITNISGADGADNGSWITDKLNASYSFLSSGAAFNTSGFGLTGINTTASFIPTLAVIAMGAIVIGILLLFFGRRKT